jgi:hypothetical protein
MQPEAGREQQQRAEAGHQRADLLGEPAAVDRAAHQEDDAEQGREAADPGEHPTAEQALELDPRERAHRRRRRSHLPRGLIAPRSERRRHVRRAALLVVESLVVHLHPPFAY